MQKEWISLQSPKQIAQFTNTLDDFNVWNISTKVNFVWTFWALLCFIIHQIFGKTCLKTFGFGPKYWCAIIAPKLLDCFNTEVLLIFHIFIPTTTRRFHIKGPRKKVNVKNWILFYEMWKIIRQIDDFGHFLNDFCNFRVFIAKKKKKIPKNDCFKKVVWILLCC